MKENKVEIKKVIIALGSNLSLMAKKPSDLLDDAIKKISEKYKIISASNKYKSPAWPKGSDAPDYINMVISIETNDNSFSVMENLLAIEETFKRKRNLNNKWAARTLDLDIIDFNGEIINSKNNDILLEVPHPRLQQRDFVLLPLCEIAPNWQHPILKQSINQLLSDYVSQNGEYSAIICQNP